jgi:hypothetical protein
MPKKIKKPDTADTSNSDLPGYPKYPEKEDIYNKEKKQSDIDPEDGSSLAGSLDEEQLGEGLDVPGAELDDADEKIGEEDEENNYYSLGGDDHDDLEEDQA